MSDDLLLNSAPPSSPVTMTPVDEATFQKKVMDASQRHIVIVDFQAQWCGPCRQLTPLLIEAAQAFSKQIVLLSMDIDRNPNLAAQIGIRSVPMVFAFWKAKPLDGFTGVRPKSAIIAFYQQCLKKARPDGVDATDSIQIGMDQAWQSLRAGDHAQAATLFATVLQSRPDDSRALAGLAECYWMSGDIERAKVLINSAPDSMAEDQALTPLRVRIKVWEKARKELPQIETWRKALKKNAQDDKARVSLSLSLFAEMDIHKAMETLLDGIRLGSERGGKCHKQFLEYLTALGENHPLSTPMRRALSSVLFS